MAYYMSTTVLAVILGIILVSTIHPGRPGEGGDEDITKVSCYFKDQIVGDVMSS